MIHPINFKFITIKVFSIVFKFKVKQFFFFKDFVLLSNIIGLFMDIDSYNLFV